MAAPGNQERGTSVNLAVRWVAVSVALTLGLVACTNGQSSTSSTVQTAAPESSTTAAAGEIATDVSAPPGVEFSGAPASGGILFTIAYTDEGGRDRGVCWKLQSDDGEVIFPILTSAGSRSDKVGKPVPISTSERTVECPAIGLSGAGPDYVWISGTYDAGKYFITTVDNVGDFLIVFNLVPS